MGDVDIRDVICLFCMWNMGSLYGYWTSSGI